MSAAHDKAPIRTAPKPTASRKVDDTGGRRGLHASIRQTEGFEAQEALLRPAASGAAFGGAVQRSRAATRSSLGAEVAATPIHTGRGKAEAEGAAAITDGQAIDVAAPVAASGVGLDGLLAHEMVHVAQSRTEGPGGDVEGEADQLATAVSQGAPVAPKVASEGRTMKKGLGEWFKENFPTFGAVAKELGSIGKDVGSAAKGAGSAAVDNAKSKLEEQGVIDPDWEKAAEDPPSTPAAGTGATAAPAKNGGVVSSTEYYAGDRVAPKNENGESKVRKHEGTEVIDNKDAAAGSHTKGTTTYTGTPDDRKTETRTKTETVTPTGDVANIEKSADTEERLDLAATAKGAVAKLQEAKAPYEREVGTLTDEKAATTQAIENNKRRQTDVVRELDSLKDAQPAAAEGAPETPTQNPRKAELEQELRELKKLEAEKTEALKDVEGKLGAAKDKVTQLENLKIRLTNNPNTVNEVAAEAEQLETPLHFEKQYSKVEESEERGHRSSVLDGSAESFDNKSRVEEDADKKLTSKQNSSVKGELDREKLGGKIGVSDSKSDERIDKAKGPAADEARDLADAGLGKSPDKKSSESKSSSGHVGYNMVDGFNAGGSQSSKVERADGSSSESSSVASASFKDGVNVNASHSAKEKQEDGTFLDDKVTVGANKDKVNAAREIGGGYEGDHVQARTKVSADGSFSVVVKPVPGVDGKPGSYQVVTTIHVGGGAGVSGSGSRKRADADAESSQVDGKASASITGGVGGTYTHSRTLSWDEAKKYLDAAEAVDKGGKAPTELPEFSFLAKAKAWTLEGGSLASYGGVLGNADTAKQMKSGDSVTLDLEASLGVNGQASVGGVGVGAEASGKVQRTLTVTRKEGGLVEVTVAFRTESQLGGSLSADEGVASASVSKKEGKSNGESVTFVLDSAGADYGDKYRTIATTLTKDQLEGLRKKYAADLTANQRSHSENSDRAGDAKVGMVGFGVSDGSAYAENVDLRGKDSSGTFSGSSHAGAKVTAGPLTLAGKKAEEDGTASVAADGQLEVSITDKDSDTGIDVGQAADSFLESRSQLDVLEKAAKLDELLQKTTAHLTTFNMSNADVELLVGRASQDRGQWNRHGLRGGVGAYNAWSALRGQLVSPTVDPEWKGVDAAKGKQLARAQALGRFFQNAGGDGREIVQSAMRNWGETATTHGYGKDGGTYAEFPPSLSKHKAAYDNYFKVIDGLGPTFDGFATDTDALSKGGQLSSELSSKALDLKSAIQGAADFEDPAARAEMLRRVSEGEATRRAVYQGFLKRWHEANGTALKAGEEKEMDVANAKRRVQELLNVCRALKSDEERVFRRVKDEMDDFFRDDTFITQQLGLLANTYKIWKQTIVDLRGQCAAAGVPANSWPVSAGPQDARSSEYEPAVKQLNYLFEDAARFKLEEAKRSASRLMDFMAY